MHHFFEAITNTKGDSLVGYFARVIDPSTLAVVPIFADNAATPISTISGVANMGKTDADGNLSFYVAFGTYHLDIYGTDATTFVKRVSNVAMAGDVTEGAQAALDAAVAAAVGAAASATVAASSATSAGTSAGIASSSATNAATSATSALAASATSGAYPNSAAANVPRGLTQASVGAMTAGSGGTNGTFALAWSSGNFSVNPTGTFTVSGGGLTAVTITGPGLYIGSSPTVPTPSFSASSGLSGAGVVLTVQFLVTSGQYYWVQSAAGDELDRYQNNSGAAAVAATIGPIPTVAAINNALAAISSTPNGTLQRWLDLVTSAGSGASATVQTALMVVEQQLRNTGIIDKLVRFSLLCGNAAAAARIPFYMRYGCGTTVDTGTISSWTEANGLTGVASISTGLTLHQAGLNAYNVSFGSYDLTDVSIPSATGYVIQASSGTWGFAPNYTGGTAYPSPAFGVGLLSGFFTNSGNIRGNLSVPSGTTNSYPTKGTMSVSLDAAGAGKMYRNGIYIPSDQTPAGVPATTPLTQTLVIKTDVVALGAYWVGEAMGSDDMAIMHAIINDFQVAIGRGVTAEGLQQ